MPKEAVKDWRGKIIGFIQTDTFGNKIVYDFYGKMLGKYDKKANVTKNFYGRILAKGDQTSMLFNLNK